MTQKIEQKFINEAMQKSDFLDLLVAIYPNFDISAYKDTPDERILVIKIATQYIRELEQFLALNGLKWDLNRYNLYRTNMSTYENLYFFDALFSIIKWCL